MSIDLFGYELPVECRTILARLLNDIHFTSDSGYEYVLKTSSYEDMEVLSPFNVYVLMSFIIWKDLYSIIVDQIC